jgi:hypothetical protein
MKIPRIKTRILWDFNPVSRRVPSKKQFSRAKNKEDILKECES